MERSSQEEEEESGNELQQQLKRLEKYWNSLKQSNPRRLQVQHCSSTPTLGTSSVRSATAAAGTLEELLEDTLPCKDLISSSLQQRHSYNPSSEGGGGWKVRNNDLVVDEILRERRAAIESGKLKGRRLFDLDMDMELDALEGSRRDLVDINIRWGEDMCSGCSSLLFQGSEVRSMSSSLSPDDDDDDDAEDDKDHGLLHDDSLGGYIHLSSTSSVVTSVGEKRHIWRGGCGCGNGERRMVLMGCLAIFLMLFALGIIISLKSFEGFQDQQSFDDSLIPT